MFSQTLPTHTVPTKPELDRSPIVCCNPSTTNQRNMKAYHILLFESFVALRAAPILGHTNNNDHGDVLDRWIHRHRHDGSNSGATTKKLHSQGRALNNGNGNCRTFSTYTLDADIDANTVRDDTSTKLKFPCTAQAPTRQWEFWNFISRWSPRTRLSGWARLCLAARVSMP